MLIKENIVLDGSLVSVINVKVSKDIKLASIYLSIFSNSQENILTTYENIVKNKKNIRYKIGSKLKSKYVPDIKFYLDDTLKKYDEINSLLKK